MIWKSKRNRDRQRNGGRSAVRRRSLLPERLEARRLFAADPIHVGVVYLETDYLESDQDIGGDSRGDRFIVSFVGGAPATELTELRIRTDKDGDGLSVGDPIYDTEQGGRGKRGAHGFQVVEVHTTDGRQIGAVAEVDDGGQELVLRLTNFRAGDRLEFTIDVDEVLRNAIDLAVFNDRLDVITSGQEFQDSILGATFNAPHYETSDADAIFLNDYGSPPQTHGLDLPPDEGNHVRSRPDRSAAAVASTVQVAKPIEIGGNVWLDNDLSGTRQSNEPPIANVEISLWRFDPDTDGYVSTGLRSTTDSLGRYRFPKSLGLLPGKYRVVETQPDALVSVAAVPGTLEGVASGTVESVNAITNIDIPLGDTSSVNHDFGEAQRAALSGFVYRDNDNDGIRESSETGIEGVTIRLVPINTIASQSVLTVTTEADGSYAFTGIAPGSYSVIEVAQPAGLHDGKDTAGTVNGNVVGIAETSSDRINEIALLGNDVGVDYNFGELLHGSLSGFVYLAAPGEDCTGSHDDPSSEPLPGVSIELQGDAGITIARTTTGVDGSYRFDDLPIGDYRIVQFTADGRIAGAAHVGRIASVERGTATSNVMIEDILLIGGDVGIEYNFCEGTPASIGGYVYDDSSNDGARDADESGIAGTLISLVNPTGTVVATALTDPSGHYEFAGLQPGEYSVFQRQPLGYLDGIDTIGQVRGHDRGEVGLANDTLVSIRLMQGDDGVEYNFGEIAPAGLSGRVHVDADGDCIADVGETTLGGVVIRLLDDAGNEVATTTTDSDGTYTFDNLTPGTYQLVEDQPSGYFEGSAMPGTAGGQPVGGSQITSITLPPGETHVDYNFCEIEASSITGKVWHESLPNQRFEPGDVPVPGVLVELIDAAGDRIRHTVTDASGNYKFESLAPGVYSVREFQPSGLFHGGQVVGSTGGQVGDDDLLVGITLQGGTKAVGYDFPEIPPAMITGYVFQDGDAIILSDVPDPSLLREYRDGRLTDDDVRLVGVTIELRDETGRPSDAGLALPGAYPGGPISTMTDSTGYYEFTGLRPGTYHVYEIQPDDFIDGLDTPGTAGGVAINPADEIPESEQAVIQVLELTAQTHPHNDAILNIPLAGGEHSGGNHFSEIIIVEPEPPEEPEETVDPEPEPPEDPELPRFDFVRLPNESVIVVPLDLFESQIRLATFASPSVVPLPRIGSSGQWAVSWHLSVINGGYPRGSNDFGEHPSGGWLHNVSERQNHSHWSEEQNASGRWTVFSPTGKPGESSTEMTIGATGGIALAGDFNGDGRDEGMIFVGGQWFVDLDGNGRWDAGDLWIRLGNELDRPVVGDWDGDGKDDIGIFGPQWRRDPERIPRDPGLPDPANKRRRLINSQRPAERYEHRIEDRQRLLRRGDRGVLRADAVDHVFQYGEREDTPLSGDWNGDGIDQIAIFRGGQWMLDSNGDGRVTPVDERFTFGHPTDEPIVGDFNGDGIDEIGVVRGDRWIIDTDGDRRITGNDQEIQVPRRSSESQPVVGDFDGDGKDEPGYYDEAA